MKLSYDCSYSFRMSLSTVLFPAPIPPPMKRRTGLLSLCAIGTITSVHCESSRDTSPIAFISSTNVVNTLATFRFFVTLSNLCSLSQFKTLIRLLAIVILVRRSLWSLITVAISYEISVCCWLFSRGCVIFYHHELLNLPMSFFYMMKMNGQKPMNKMIMDYICVRNRLISRELDRKSS